MSIDLVNLTGLLAPLVPYSDILNCWSDRLFIFEDFSSQDALISD